MSRILLFFILQLIYIYSFSQEKVIVSPFITVDGEKILTSNIPQLDVIDFKDNNERKSFFKLKRRVLKVYPYAIETRLKVDSLNIALENISKKRKKRRYLREVTKIIKSQYTSALKKLTMKEGRILIKLIYRETGISTYYHLRKYRGWWNTTIWQTFARMYDMDLKTTFDPDNVREDMFIDKIIEQAKREGRFN